MENEVHELKYRVARIPKGAGSFREIYIASPEDNRRLRGLLPELEAILVSADFCHVNYAFERGKNCALNALQHLGHRYTLSMDLENFFDSVSIEHVMGIIPDRIVDQCFINGSPKQGLPTSPLIATIAFLKCDTKIVQLLETFGIIATYTRYADDLIFSFDDRRQSGKIRVIVCQLVERYGFKLNLRKTKLQDAKNGRVIITGIAVDANSIYPTRRTKRRIRAAIHQENADSFRGLVEWSRCKLPAAMFSRAIGTPPQSA